MATPARLKNYIETEKQQKFFSDFLAGWENYETWDQATVGDSGPAQRTFTITEEDIVSYNKSCGETDPLLVDSRLCEGKLPDGRGAPASDFRDSDRVLQPRREGHRDLEFARQARVTRSSVSKPMSRLNMASFITTTGDDLRQIRAAGQAVSTDAARLPQ